MKTLRLCHVIILMIALSLSCSGSLYAYDPNRIVRPLPIGESDPLPEGWKFKDIGSPQTPSDWCYSAEQGVYYIKNFGKEMWGASGDQGAFIYFETDEDKQVVTRIMDAEVVEMTAAKGFIMVRAGLEHDDPWVYLEVKQQGGNKVCFCWRLEKNTYSGSVEVYSGTNGSTAIPPNCFPRWLKFVRQGQYTSGYHKDDVEGAQWVKLGVKKVSMRGKAYMGIGGSAIFNDAVYQGNYRPAFWIFDNLAVTDIEVPYEVLNPDVVATSFLEPLKPGKSKDIDITTVFGHALGEYFTIDCESVDPSIATSYFWERAEPNATDGEEFRKFVRVTGIKEGVTSIKLRCTINGYSMSTDYALNVSDGKSKPKSAYPIAPYGWELKNLKVPVNPDLVWGEEFVTKRLSLQKQFPIFLGCWEYDWSVKDESGILEGGNHGTISIEEGKTESNDGPTTISAHPTYISNAKLYNFRDLDFTYAKISGFSKDTTRKEISGASSIDLSYLPANDTVNQVNKTDFISIDRGSDGQYKWETATGFWTEIINGYDQSGNKIRGYPYLANCRAGDWICHTVYAPRSGYYSFYPMTAVKDITNKPSIQIDVNGVMQVKELYLNKSANAYDWKKGTTASILLNEGKNQIKIQFNSGDINYLGGRVAFATASKEPYAGILFDTLRYVKAEERIDTTLMADDEKQLYRRCLDGTIFAENETWDKDSVDIFLRSLPTRESIDLNKVVERYKGEISSEFRGSSRQDTLDYIDKELMTSFDSLTFVTTQQSQFKHIDVTSYLFKRGIDPRRAVEISMKIDSIANAGKGTYMGIMIRSLFYDGNKLDIASNSDFAAFGVAAYEGARLSYRWNYGFDYRKFDNESVAQDVYIKIRINEFAPGYLTAYYSYDNLYWWEYLIDPLKIGFLNVRELNQVAVGVFLTGGNFANDATLAFAKAKDIRIKTFEEGEQFESINSAKDMYCTPLHMSKSDISGDELVDIFFNVVKPGLVSINVYDVYGILVESIQDFVYMPFSKEEISVSHSFKNLKTGIYLLRIEAPGNEQSLRFRYKS